MSQFICAGLFINNIVLRRRFASAFLEKKRFLVELNAVVADGVVSLLLI